jgi:hypothetical protein
MSKRTRRENSNCGRFVRGGYCYLESGHAGACQPFVPNKRVCGEWTADGNRCTLRPNHGGECQ